MQAVVPPPSVDGVTLGITGANVLYLLDGAVGTAKLAAGAVTAPKLAAGSVDSGALAAGAVTNPKLGANAVDAAKLANGAVGNTQLAAGAVDTNVMTAAAKPKIYLQAVIFGNGAAFAGGAAGSTNVLCTGKLALPFAGTVTAMKVNGNPVPNNATTLGIAVRKNGVAQAMKVQFSPSDTVDTPKTDSSHTFSVVAGDLIDFAQTLDAGAGATNTPTFVITLEVSP